MLHNAASRESPLSSAATAASIASPLRTAKGRCRQQQCKPSTAASPKRPTTNALTTALALLPTTVASLDAQQYNEVLTKVAIDDGGTVAAFTTPCISQAAPDQLSEGARRVSNLCPEVPLPSTTQRRSCVRREAAGLRVSVRGVAGKGRSESSGPLLQRSGAGVVRIAGCFLLEAYADVRCKAEPLQNALVDAEARANAQRCLAVLWSRGPADSFAAAAAGVLTALEAAEDALGPVAAAEALIMAARTRAETRAAAPAAVGPRGDETYNADRVTHRCAAGVDNAAPRPEFNEGSFGRVPADAVARRACHTGPRDRE